MVRPLAETPERPQIEAAATLRQGGEIELTLRNAGVSAEDPSTAAGLVADAVALPDITRGAALDIVLGRRPNKSVPPPPASHAFRAAFDPLIPEPRRAGKNGDNPCGSSCFPV